MPETPVPVRARPVTASQLYDLASCRHRVATDFARPRSERTPPDATSRLLLERGLELEARVRARLGGVTIDARPEDPAGAMAETLDAMRRGEALVHQGVLVTRGRLAIPDVMRRVDGASELGDHHYEPGDIKSGLHPRTDQVLQVVFAAKLLEDLQGRRPDEGFLILGDETESRFRVDEVWDSAMTALAALESIAHGEMETFPFYSPSCARCRWSAACLPELARGPDLSLVAGMTWTRKRILASHGIATAGALAALGADELARLAGEGVATDGLRRLQKQAEALVTGRIIDERARRSGEGARADERRAGIPESFLLCEWSPLDEAHPFFFAWGRRGGHAEGDAGTGAAGAGAAPGIVSMETRLLLDPLDPRETSELADALAGWAAGSRGPVYHFGAGAPAAIDWLAERHPEPAALERLTARLRNLAPLVRRGAYLPVRRYVPSEIVAVLEGRPLPALEELPDAAFLWAEELRRKTEGDWSGKLVDRARSDLQALAVLRDWAERSS